MSVAESLGWTFDTVAPSYEKLRPGYVDALYRAIFDYIPVCGDSEVLEIGIGGGQATLPLLRTGCRLTAVEYGENLAALCREKFKAFPGFSVVTNRFEDAALAPGAFDLVFSASAFHWVPEEIGYPKVFSLLKPGGAFARFANHPFPDKGRPALAEEIQRIYADYYYKYHADRKPEPPRECDEAQARQRAQIAEKHGFVDIRWALFHRTRTFSAREYVALLGTYSDHIAIERTVREAFFSAIERAIDAHGGAFTLYDTLDLQLARKPTAPRFADRT